MKYKFLFLILFFLFAKTGICQATTTEELYKFPLKVIYTYCQSRPDTPFSTKVLSYDTQNKLKLISSFNSRSTDTNFVAFTYSEIGLITSRTYFNSTTPEKTSTWKYKYDKNNKLIFEGFGEEDMDKKNIYTYNEKGQLIESTDECNYNHWHYGYEYDAFGRLILKYKRGDNEPIEYKYSQYRLIKEIRYNRNRQTEISYEYDDNGLLLIKKDDDKVIEKNIYDNGQLTERWTYYFGIDPGYYPCSSQYILKFEYY